MWLIRSKSESRLEKQPVYCRHCRMAPLCWMTCRVPIFGFERSKTRNVITKPKDRFHLWLIRKHLFAKRHVGVFETVIRFQRLFKPWQFVSELDIRGVAVGHSIRGDIAVIDVVELR